MESRHDDDRQRAFTDQRARLVAAALEFGPGGELGPAMHRLAERSPSIVAVAEIDPLGGVIAIAPDRAAPRDAVTQLVTRACGASSAASTPFGVARVDVPIDLDGGSLSAIGAVVPLNGNETLLSRRLVVMFTRDDSDHGTASLAWFAGSMMLPLGLGYRSMRRWFERRVAAPLRGLVGGTGRGTVRERAAGTDALAWRETNEIADQLEELLQSLAETDARTKRVERDAARKLRDTEATYKRELRRATDRATTDPLTRLRNRAYLEEHLDRIVEAQRAARADVAAVVIDVDNFKQLNDTQGHLAGDEILKFAGQLLQAVTRPTDVAARYGGDEFVIVMPGASRKDAGRVADRLVKMFAQQVRQRPGATRISLSAGVASLVADRCMTGQDLLSCADHALYIAKRGGKNAVAAAEA